jgi:hypothetical protein
LTNELKVIERFLTPAGGNLVLHLCGSPSDPEQNEGSEIHAEIYDFTTNAVAENGDGVQLSLYAPTLEMALSRIAKLLGG